ncbi:tRNA N(3)-methylcytidine methyltransferase METTL6 [Condylostylus longicornis]|uniref:tRNA N(3)-methylcytidine methyltransferase METTL6 n=1 Tax=Condylostylus longicornis TaxID=2530218 RepID=UPI00244E32B0|nr:tRNA N(3)-methylcytidine methyltransferase METTL6 [Condylostylus longicornis]
MEEVKVDEDNFQTLYSTSSKIISTEEREQLKKHDLRLVSDGNAKKLEKDAKKYWDLFYKRNDTKFFKNRHWITREFSELIHSHKKLIILEAGCGVGNLMYPLVEENFDHFYYACDFSKRAIDHVLNNPLFDPLRINAFQCDITTSEIFNTIEKESLDIVILVFVLSSIHPENFKKVISIFQSLLKPGGLLFFRDYGLYDMTQLRFKPGHKIAENFYARQDGTRSYYFSEDEVSQLFQKHGFQVMDRRYVHRRTINIKEGIDVPRIFIQGKFMKI